MLWLLSMWEKAGCPSPVNFIELGPGTGVMMVDMLRVNTYYILYVQRENMFYFNESWFVLFIPRVILSYSCKALYYVYANLARTLA